MSLNFLIFFNNTILSSSQSECYCLPTIDLATIQKQECRDCFVFETLKLSELLLTAVQIRSDARSLQEYLPEVLYVQMETSHLCQLHLFSSSLSFSYQIGTLPFMNHEIFINPV